ncbi:hypothetical protein AAKU52_003137 [Pedobacter sp. CG_S7]|uniref:hypothetical protein n=1 Tax=Pedobacter sp. CG_S7 TaxID=3143930 RepID=UPI0033940560
MKLFRKNTGPIDHDAMAQRIAGNIIGRQQRLAAYLNGKTKNVTVKTWLFILIGFCCLLGSYCAFLLITALH